MPADFPSGASVRRSRRPWSRPLRELANDRLTYGAPYGACEHGRTLRLPANRRSARAGARQPRGRTGTGRLYTARSAGALRRKVRRGFEIARCQVSTAPAGSPSWRNAINDRPLYEAIGGGEQFDVIISSYVAASYGQARPGGSGDRKRSGTRFSRRVACEGDGRERTAHFIRPIACPCEIARRDRI